MGILYLAVLVAVGWVCYKRGWHNACAENESLDPLIRQALMDHCDVDLEEMYRRGDLQDAPDWENEGWA